MKNNKYLKSFTLIELIVVIAIIGLLASIVLVSTNAAIGKAKIARSLRFSQSVHHAVGAYLVGEWKFEEGEFNTCQNPQNQNYDSLYCQSYYDDLCDSSGNRNHGCLNETAPWPWVDSDIPQLGKAGQFLGNGNFVNIPDSPNLEGMSELTIQIWFKTLVNPPSTAIQFIYKSNVYIFEIINNVGIPRVTFIVYRNLGGAQVLVLSDISSFKVGQWYHLAASYYGGGGNIYPRLRLYLNGYLMATNNVLSWSPGTILNNTTNEIRLGYTSASTNFMIDEVRIYQGELTQSEIRKLYVEGAKERGLLAEE